MMNLLDQFFTLNFAVLALSGVAAFATILTLALPFFKGDRLEARMKAVALERASMLAGRRQSTGVRDILRQDASGLIKVAVDRLNLFRLVEAGNMRAKLKQAGLRGRKHLYAFALFRFAMPFLTFAAVLSYLSFVEVVQAPYPVLVVMALIGAGIGFYLPNLFVENLIKRRRDAISRVFPDALDLLLICVEAGMSIEAAFNKVASEIGSQSVELAEELSLTTAELSYLQERRQAYENLAERIGLPGVKAVSVSLVQAERYGTPLAQALRVMAKENRDLRMSEAERRAAALPPKLTVPMVAFFLPVLFVVILGPAIIQLMQI